MTSAWSLSNPDSYTNATNALTVAAARNSYETLFPNKYRLYRAKAGTGTLLANDVTPVHARVQSVRAVRPGSART